MKKSRIEVTRERWTRIRIESPGSPLCPSCRGSPDLVFLATASERMGVRDEDVNGVIRSGLLSVWETPSGEALVCLGCLRKLREEKAI